MAKFGFEGACWIKEASTYGEALTMDTGGLLLYARPNITLEETIGVVEAEHLHGYRWKEENFSALGLKSVQGTISGVLMYGANMAYIFKHAFGKITTTGSSPYEHKATANNYLFPGFSLAINKGGATYIYDGLQVASLRLTLNVGGPVEWSLDVVGSAERVVSLVTPPTAPTMPTSNKIVQVAHITTLTLGGSAYDIQGLEFTVANTLEAGEDRAYTFGGAGRDMLPASHCEITGTIRRRQTNDGASSLGSDFWDWFKGNTETPIVATMTHPSDSDYGYTVALNSTYLRGESPKPSDMGTIFEQSPFTVYDLGDAATYLLAKDDVTTPADATGAYAG